MSNNMKPRGVTDRGTPILDGNDPRVRKVAQMMADTLEAMIRLDQESTCATDVLFMLMRDGLWCRDNYHGANNPKISDVEKESRIATARNQILNADRFNDLSERYIDHCASIGKGRG